MTNAEDTPDPDHEIMVLSFMKATGLSKEAVQTLLTDDELDELCDSVLSDLASPPKKVSSSDAER